MITAQAATYPADGQFIRLNNWVIRLFSEAGAKGSKMMLIFPRKNKGQVFPLLVTITVILIIAALISANLGKVSLDRLYCMNGADAGAVAGAADYTMGYNKAPKPDMAMVITWVAIQVFLAIPMVLPCIGPRGTFAAVAKTFNDIMYNYVKFVVLEYSKSAPRDAYYYAFINAGIDDRTKADGTDRPGPGVTWNSWINQKSRFGDWLNHISRDENWADPSSHTYYTYLWGDGSGRSVTVYVSSSGIEQLRYKTMPLIGLYWFFIPPIIPWWHGNIKAWIKDPSRRRSVSVRVERSRANPEVSLGFWKALHPATRASATAEMFGGALGVIPHINGYDFRLSSTN